MILRTLALIALAYAAVTALAWLFQHRLLYLPTTPGREWAATPANIGLAYEDLRIRTDDGVELSAWLVPADPDRGLLLFFHGNAGNISHRLESIEIFHRLGLSVLIVDYRGYGRSEGRPSERGTYRDAAAVWQFSTGNLGRPADEIVVFGRSLGAAIAAQLADTTAVPPAALIIESPFTSVPDMAQRVYPFLPARWLTRFDYPTRDYVAAAGCPVLVVHSEDDEIIPVDLGREVFAAAPEPKRFLSLAGGHNTGFLESAGVYTRGIDAFLSEPAGLPRPVQPGTAGG
ncbi:MAG: alpha/beta hydrolase [Gammaproteobacteria bacterium]|nr:alpha/beta hydrolase [Gammaproteobacteria bacterium]